MFTAEQLEILKRHRPATVKRWFAPRRGIEAFAVVDQGLPPALGELRLGGGTDPDAALTLACRLARSASIRLGLLGSARTGGAVVVVADPQLDQAVLRRELKEWMPEVPLQVAAGDELPEEVARFEGLLSVDPEARARLRARVLGACLDALAPHELALPRALVLGAGATGRDAAATLQARGLAVSLWDPPPERARALASSLGPTAIEGPWIDSEAELLVPCLPDAVIDDEHAAALRATVICGLSPRVLASARAGELLEQRERWVVPPALAATADPIAWAHAAGQLDPEAALTAVAETAQQVLAQRGGAGDRAIALAIERSRSAAADQRNAQVGKK